MDAVGAYLGRELDVVVDDEGDACSPADVLELTGKRQGLVAGRALLAQLDEGDAALHGVADAPCERATS